MTAALKPWAGIGICVGAAALLCLLLEKSTDTKFVAPAVSLQAVILAALYFGRISALVGSIAASVILTIFLFPPLGSFLIHDSVERTMLFVFQAASFVVAYMSPGVPPRRSQRFFR
jgi:K+-sensing histidine kinase KdpD